MSEVQVYGGGSVALSARVLNDSIAKGAKALGSPQVPFDFFCECGDPACRDVHRLTAAQYRIRRSEALVDHPR